MRPESPFLENLQKSGHIYEDFEIPTASYRSPLDVVMLPLKSPRWQQGDNVRFWSPIHSALLWEKKLHADLLERLDAGRTRQETLFSPATRSSPQRQLRAMEWNP